MINWLHLSAQNIFQLSFSLGQGNASWIIRPLTIPYYDPFGNSDTSFTVYTHGTSPTVTANIIALYTINRFCFGLGFSTQHYFLNELITEANILQPTIFNEANNPQPTHFKFYPHIGYAFVKQENFALFLSIAGGMFLARNQIADEIETNRWFLNVGSGLDLSLNENLSFQLAPSFDFSRINTTLVVAQDQKLFYNIYSFCFTAGIKYNFTN